MNPIKKLHALGQSLWFDNIDRRLLENGDLAAMIERGDIRGVTSNPSIFNKAISNSDEYDQNLEALAKQGHAKEEIYEHLAVADIQAACDLFLPLYERTDRGDGYVSLEVSPYLAHETQATIEEAARLWNWVDRPNLMIKIPGTEAGLPAITETIAAGINVNVTLLFSIKRYARVMDAYMKGLERRLAAGEPIDQVASVASFFVSRIETKVDDRLENVIALGGQLTDLAKNLSGKIAIASAKLAYVRHKDVFSGERWDMLALNGARLQRPLWASTSTKNPDYPDTKYVDSLIAPRTVNTVPPRTLQAFRDHGTAALTLDDDLAAAQRAMDNLSTLDISFDEITGELEDEGVEKFAAAFTRLLDTIEVRRKEIAERS